MAALRCSRPTGDQRLAALPPTSKVEAPPRCGAGNPLRHPSAVLVELSLTLLRSKTEAPSWLSVPAHSVSARLPTDQRLDAQRWCARLVSSVPGLESCGLCQMPQPTGSSSSGERP